MILDVPIICNVFLDDVLERDVVCAICKDSISISVDMLTALSWIFYLLCSARQMIIHQKKRHII